MKNFVIPILAVIFLAGCMGGKEVATSNNPPGNADSVQYELIVDELGYDSWISTNARPVWYHEQAFYRNWNILYTTEFNYRVLHYPAVHPFTEWINYSPQIDYGIDLDYKLYWYFKFIEDKYNTRLHITSR
jgi:hypothetical protein